MSKNSTVSCTDDRKKGDSVSIRHDGSEGKIPIIRPEK